MNTNPVSNTLSLYSSGVSQGKLRLLQDYIIPGKVLDVGCGNGLYGVYLEALGYEVHQVDLHDRRDARAHHLPFAIMDAQNISFECDSFHNVIAFDIMEHLEDDAKFLRDIRCVCKNRLFLSVPHSDDEQISRIGLTHVHFKDKTHQHEYTRHQLEEMLPANGFKTVCIRPNYATGLPRFAFALAKNNKFARFAARYVSLQCKAFLKLGLFENRTVGDWYCVAE